ncbi:hypothetical protein BKA70DRAFT_1227337 [Coprinopsis sp. MPI-PUGE-AT-0042]|nr:hypothetical protein BKA70DRAFT_1227337 [Coprinopsis sp. MPI-PUGE-AT-0042]
MTNISTLSTSGLVTFVAGRATFPLDTMPYPLDANGKPIAANELEGHSLTHHFDLPKCYHGTSTVGEVQPNSHRGQDLVLRCSLAESFRCEFSINVTTLLTSESLVYGYYRRIIPPTNTENTSGEDNPDITEELMDSPSNDEYWDMPPLQTLSDSSEEDDASTSEEEFDSGCDSDKDMFVPVSELEEPQDTSMATDVGSAASSLELREVLSDLSNHEPAWVARGVAELYSDFPSSSADGRFTHNSENVPPRLHILRHRPRFSFDIGRR